MTFNSLAFVFFLPAVYLLFLLFPPTRRRMLLLAASYFFYCFITPWYGLLLLFTTAIDFYAAPRMESAAGPKAKKSWLLLSIVANLSVLLSFKYAAFFANCGIAACNSVWENHYPLFHALVVPAGLSFYTFQSMSYTIDVYRGRYKAERHFGLFALFVSFFPHLVAGPIQKFSHLAPQLQNPSAPAPDSIFPQLRLITWGFFKKLVIADNLAKIVDPVYSNVQAFSGSTLLFSGLLFTLQLYADFSGYTDIATGVAKLFGVDFTPNFRRPLLSRSVYAYWKRHNISITNWFREYVYFTLGGNRGSAGRWIFNIVLVFLLSGLWHGASLTFLAWGLLHAIAYLWEYFFHRKLNITLPALAGWLLTLLFLSFSYIAFRAESTSDLGFIYSSVFSHFNAGAFKTELHRVSDWFPLLLCGAGVLLLFAKEGAEELKWDERKPIFRYLRPVVYMLLFFAIFLAGDFSSNEFIYFKF